MLDDFGRGYLKALKDHNMKDDCSLGCCDAQECKAQPKKEKKMNRVNIEDISVNIEARADATDERQRVYLQGRLNQLCSYREVDLMKKFGLLDDDAPRNASELVDRIKSGKFVLPSEDEQKKLKTFGYGPTSGITWRDPALKKDQDGFDAANEVLSEMFRNAKDDIRIQSPTDGLKTLRAFRDATVTVPAA